MTGSFTAPHPHDLIWVRGPDAVAFLDGLLSQSVAAIPPGIVRRSLLLSPRGKLDALLWLLGGGSEIGIAVEGGFAASVAASVNRFKIRIDAEITIDERPLTEAWGPVAAELVGPSSWVASPELVADLPLLHGSIRRVLTTREVRIDAASAEEAEAVRIAMGEPRLGVDIGEDTIPEEAGLVEGAVDFDKGCYLGQELVARIDSRGHVNRHLRGLLLEEPAAAASPVATEAGDVGWVTSAAVSAELGPIALALVRREVEVGDRVIVAGAVPATVTDLPMSEG